jgi:hypothetical protein
MKLLLTVYSRTALAAHDSVKGRPCLVNVQILSNLAPCTDRIAAHISSHNAKDRIPRFFELRSREFAFKQENVPSPLAARMAKPSACFAVHGEVVIFAAVDWTRSPPLRPASLP